MENEEAFAARQAAMGAGLPEEERRRLEAAGLLKEGQPPLYDIEGEDLIKEIREARPEELSEVVSAAFAFKEGLVFGPDGYDLEEAGVLLDLQNLFTSTEGAIERPQPYYLDLVMKKRTQQRVREIRRLASKEERHPSEDERKEIHQLVSLENQMEGRKIIDTAFIQRMKSCEDPETAANLLSRAPDYGKTVMPDKGHWQGALSGEFGEKVDRVLREIVKAGITGISTEELRKEGISSTSVKEIKNTIYTFGFENTETFRVWLTHLSNAANQRMDVVWFAWRLALLWELPDQIGEKEIKGDVKLPFPPIGNSLLTWVAHLEQKRALEFGWDSKGNRKRASKYISHSGYPLSLGKIGNLCESFLRESKVKREGKDVSLWNLWWEEGMKVGGDFEMDRNILPWALTEVQPRGLATDEFPSGSFGKWILRRFRAFQVLKDIRSRPSLRDLGDPDFFISRIRNWEKVLGTYEGKEEELGRPLKPEENPRTWWVGSLIMAHHLKNDKEIPLVKDEEEMAYRTYQFDEAWSEARKGDSRSKKSSVREILDDGQQCGFLRPVDVNWLVKNLNIPRP